MKTITITLGPGDIQSLENGHPFIWNLDNGGRVELVMSEGALSARRQLRKNIQQAQALGSLLTSIDSFL